MRLKMIVLSVIAALGISSGISLACASEAAQTDIPVSASARETSDFLAETRSREQPYTEAVLDIEEQSVTLDGKTASPDVLGDGLEDHMESSEEAAAYLEETAPALEVTKNQDDTLTVRSPYQSRRLAVRTDSPDDLCGASACIYDPDLGYTILSFDTEEETEKACEKLSQRYECAVDRYLCADDVLEETITTASENISWGISYMGLDAFPDRTFDRDVTIAMIDTGLDADSELFTGRISADSYDLAEGRSELTDLDSHGTHVAGIIAAATPENVDIMVLRIFNDDGDCYELDLLNGIQYAVEHDADLINISLGYPLSDDTTYTLDFDRILTEADEKGIPVICAAGNHAASSSEEADTEVMFPALHADTIAVSALTKKSAIASYSNYGEEVDFAAPGSSVRSTVPGGTYKTKSGTSQAAPHITAAMACMLSADPDLTGNDLYDEAVSYCEDLGDSGKDICYGNGCVHLDSFLFDQSDFSAVTMEVSGTPAKTEYDAGEAFDPTGLTFTLVNGQGDRLDVTDDVVFEQPEPGSDHAAVSYTHRSGWTWSGQITGLTIGESIRQAEISLETDIFRYSGSAAEPAVTVRHGETVLTQDVDYTVSYEDNINAGQASAVIQGIGSYAESSSVSYTIEPADLPETAADLPDQTYTGEALKPEISFTDSSLTLKKGRDYVLSYSNNVNAGQASVCVKGTGNYTGQADLSFRILPKALSETVYSVNNSKYTYTGQAIRAGCTIYDGSVKLKKNESYQVSYQNNVEIGKATAVIKGIGNYTGTVKKTYQIVPGKPKLTVKNTKDGAKISWKKTSGAQIYYLYRNGKQIASTNSLSFLDTAVKSNGKKYTYKLVAAADAGGKQFRSKTSSAVTGCYLKAPVIRSLISSKAGTLNLSWSSNTKAAGYQILLKYGSSSKTVTIKNRETLKKTVSSLKKGKKYRVYVRSYQSVSGKYSYSPWSSGKAVTIRKW